MDAPSNGASLRWAYRLLAAGVLLLAFSVASVTQADPDLWGHVRFGLDIWQTRTLPSIDPYSFTQDVPWVNHEWLSELQMALAWAVGGTAGLAALKGALVFGAFVLMWNALRGTDATVRLALLAPLALGTLRMVQTLRPQLWTLLFLAILCRVLLSTDRRTRWWLPLLYVLWANVHGGWVVGLGILGVWCGVEVILEPSRRVSAVRLAVACAAATLINPYGWHLWAFINDTVRMTRDITEWQPLTSVHPLIWIPWLSAVAAAVWLALRHDTPGLASAAVLVMLAYSSFRVERITPLFVASAVLLAAPRIRERWPSRVSLRLPALPGPRRAFVAVLAAVTMGIAAAAGASSFSCIRADGDGLPDAGLVRRLDAASPGRLVVFFDWGQYALWHWGPQLRVSMDGRRETVYSNARLDEHAAILRGTPAGLGILEDWQAEYVWLPVTSGATERWLAANGYRIEARTERAFLAVRADLQPLPQPAGTTTTRRCFPD